MKVLKLMFSFFILCLPLFAQVESDTLSVYVTYKAPVLDGILESDWMLFPETEILKWQEGFAPAESDSDISGNFRLCWDDINFYLFCEVRDDDINATELGSPWMSDGIELFFDGENEKNTSYDINDIQLRYVYGQYEGGPGIAGLGSFEWLETEVGYNFELAIPFDTLTFEGIENHIFGFEIGLNDNDYYELQNVRKWWSESGMSWNDPSIFGTAQLTTSSFANTIPHIYSITDIPDDEGGWVKIMFSSSAVDTVFNSNSGKYYIEIHGLSGWKSIAKVQAIGLPRYSVNVQTPGDKTSDSSGIYEFRVRAEMLENTYISDIATGYSLDNTKPKSPQNLRITTSDSVFQLSWDKNAELDLFYYTIYKGENARNLSILTTTQDSLYVDNDIEINQTYYYGITATDSSGNESAYSKIVNAKITGIVNEEEHALSYSLSQNYPNPFNPETMISYILPEAGNVDLSIYNILGQKISTLVSIKQTAGEYQIQYDANKLAAGVYYYKLQVDNIFVEIKKMVLIK